MRSAKRSRTSRLRSRSISRITISANGTSRLRRPQLGRLASRITNGELRNWLNGVTNELRKDQKMKVDIFTLCDFANTDSAGKLNILGSFDRINAHTMPMVHPLCCLAIKMRFE